MTQKFQKQEMKELLHQEQMMTKQNMQEKIKMKNM